jgi:hypothetical protein
MPKRLRDADGLTPQEAKFCVYLAQGLTQADAFRKCWPKSRQANERLYKSASELAAKPHIRGRIRELLKGMKASDLLSSAEWMQWVTEIAREAHAAKQYAAAGGLVRLLGQANGTLKEHGLGQSELGFSEENLIERLAGQNPELKRQLAALLGKPTFQKQDSSDTKH